MTPEDEKRVRELITEDRSNGCFIYGCQLILLAMAAHYSLSEGGLPGLFHRVVAVLFGQGLP